MKTPIQIIGLLLLFGLASQPLYAATYKYQDQSGNTVYSQNPPEDPNTPYEVMDKVRSHARPGSNTSPATTSSPSLEQDTGGNDIVAQEQQQAQKIREENCAAAKKQLKIYTAYRRIRNEDGEVIRVDDETRQQKIDQAEQAIRDFCD